MIQRGKSHKVLSQRTSVNNPYSFWDRDCVSATSLVFHFADFGR